MADIFVYSAAAGANNGTSWTDAYTSLASTSGAAAGDVVKVEYRHTQTGLSAAINWSNGTLSNPVKIISVDSANSDAPRVGAAVSWTSNGAPTGNIYSWGMSWRASNTSLSLGAPADGLQVHESGSLVISSGTGSISFAITNVRRKFVLINTDVDLSASGSATNTVTLANTSSPGVIEWRGGTYTARAAGQTNLFGTNTFLTAVRLEGVVFSGNVTNLFSGGASHSMLIDAINCVAPSYTNVWGTEPTHAAWRVNLQGFVAGTIAAPVLPPSAISDRCGAIRSSLSRYRIGGADDGSQANPYSWEMASDADAAPFVAALPSPPITRWVGTGSQTVTVYLAGGATLKDDEFWVEVTSPSEAGSATAQSKYQTTRAATLATPANLATDGTSAWTGTGVGTKQKCGVTINPTVAGIVTVRAYLAKTGATVYVDPVIDVAGDVSGKSRFVEGVQTFSAVSGGGTVGGPPRVLQPNTWSLLG